MHVAARASKTYGDLAATFASDYGLDPDPWQRFVLDDWLSLWGQQWAALTCGLAVPRQNGKNALLEVRELFGAVGLGERILHTAHEVKTAQKHFRRLKYFFGDSKDDKGARFPELNKLVKQVRSVNGQEAIILHKTDCPVFKTGVCKCEGGSIEVVARSKNSGRGFTVDVLVMDEAQEMSEDALEALMPTTSAAPLGNPQWIFTGTPPGPSASGEVFTRVRSEALSKHPGRLAWSEWSVEGEVDLDDRAHWRMTNPALDAGRLQLDVIEGERARFSDGGFARERLGRWANDQEGSRAISAERWAELEGLPDPDGFPSYAVAFSQDGMRMSLGGGFKAPGSDVVHIELIDDPYVGAVEGGLTPLVKWFTERNAQGSARWRRAGVIVLAGSAGAGVLKQMLVHAGVNEKRIIVANTPQYLQACEMTRNAAEEKTLTHKADDQEPLDNSVAVCDRDKRGGWVATVPGGDETPIEAVSLALWGARTTKRKPKSERSTANRGVIL